MTDPIAGAAAPFSVSDELFSFITPDGKAYSVDLIDAHIRQNEIVLEQQRRDDTRQEASRQLGAEKDDAADAFWFLGEFQKWLTENGVPAMRRGQLDRLWVELRLAFADRKKKQRQQLDAMRDSPNSTDSTPPAED